MAIVNHAKTAFNNQKHLIEGITPAKDDVTLFEAVRLRMFCQPVKGGIIQISQVMNAAQLVMGQGFIGLHAVSITPVSNASR
jgi:hypothetical protein